MNVMYHAVRRRFVNETESGQVEILRGTITDVVRAIPDLSLDFAYVDGDHRFEGVLNDLRRISAKIKPGGVIFLDDYVVGHWWADGVVRALNAFLGEAATEWQILRAMGNQAVIRKHLIREGT